MHRLHSVTWQAADLHGSEAACVRPSQQHTDLQVMSRCGPCVSSQMALSSVSLSPLDIGLFSAQAAHAVSPAAASRMSVSAAAAESCAGPRRATAPCDSSPAGAAQNAHSVFYHKASTTGLPPPVMLHVALQVHDALQTLAEQPSGVLCLLARKMLTFHPQSL